MSKILPRIPLVFASFVLILQIFTIARGQELEVTVKISAGSTLAEVRGSFASEGNTKTSREISFLDNYGGLKGLTERLSMVNLFGTQDSVLAQRKFLPGEHFNSPELRGFGYSMDLKPTTSSFAAAHVSWINPEGGILFLDDLLPQSPLKTAKVKLDLPNGWSAVSTDYPSSIDQSTPSDAERNILTVSDIEKGVIFIGPTNRRRVIWSGSTRLVLNQRGDWGFQTDEALSAAASIFANYERAFGSISTHSVLIGISKFPTPVGFGNWEADSRGRTVTIVSTDAPFKTQSLQQLHEQLRHELFHLWIPNGLNLTGDYDWFYEGFALYQSLKLGVEVNRLRFDDFLDTLSRAYDIDRTTASKLSLVEASKNRWNGANTRIHARGMLAAFLCDIAMLENSKRKSSVTMVVREVLEKHGTGKDAVDGNEAVIAILKGHAELIPIIDRYILGVDSLEWTGFLDKAGLIAEEKDLVTELKVKANPSGRQRALLDALGYNNWRKVLKEN